MSEKINGFRGVVKPDSTKRTQSQRHGEMVPKIVNLIILVAFIGWAVNVFLTGVHFLILSEGFVSSVNKGALTMINYGYVMGIPLTLLGAIYYSLVLFMTFLWIESRSLLILKTLTPVIVIGVISSIFLSYLQVFVIETVYPYFMVSAAPTTILLLLEILLKNNTDSVSTRDLIRTHKDVFNRKTLVWSGFVFLSWGIPMVVFWIATISPFKGS